MHRQPPRRRGTTAALLIAVLIGAACTGGTVPATDHAATAAPAPSGKPAAYVEGDPYQVTVDPADFVALVDHPYWPLVPGTTTVFEGDGERIVVEVTGYTKEVLGVATTVVRDRVYDKGRLIEDTLDWYAQDRSGNVWYFGEETTEYEDGKPVTTAGSWEAGVDGAMPGVVMPAEPRVGDTYRNEYYAGEAEDLAKVIELDGTISVPVGTFNETIRTEDWTPLEPSQLERKTYAPGVGLVAEGPLDDPMAIQLVEVRRP